MLPLEELFEIIAENLRVIRNEEKEKGNSSEVMSLCNLVQSSGGCSYPRNISCQECILGQPNSELRKLDRKLKMIELLQLEEK